MEWLKSLDWMLVGEKIIVPILTSIIAFGGIAYSVKKTINNSENTRQEQYEHERRQNAIDRELAVKQDIIRWKVEDGESLYKNSLKIIELIRSANVNMIFLSYLVENNKTEIEQIAKVTFELFDTHKKVSEHLEIITPIMYFDDSDDAIYNRVKKLNAAIYNFSFEVSDYFNFKEDRDIKMNDKEYFWENYYEVTSVLESYCIRYKSNLYMELESISKL